MGLLQDIQADAINQDAPLSNMLRKCLVLAYKLNNDEFRQWIEHEMNGYPANMPVPNYRIYVGEPRANARNIAWHVTGSPIPAGAIPEEYLEDAMKLEFRQGVGAYASIQDNGELKHFWPSWLVAAVNQRINKNLVISEGYVPLPIGFFNGMLDVIRNKVLEFVLQIERENPEADTVPSGSTPIPQEKVTQIFHTTVSGGQAAIGSSGRVEQVEKQIRVGDQESLRAALRTLGVPENAISELDDILEESDPQEIKEPTGKLPEWAKKAGGLVRDTGVEVGTKVVTELIKGFAGIA